MCLGLLILTATASQKTTGMNQHGPRSAEQSTTRTSYTASGPKLPPPPPN